MCLCYRICLGAFASDGPLARWLDASALQLLALVCSALSWCESSGSRLPLVAAARGCRSWLPLVIVVKLCRVCGLCHVPARLLAVSPQSNRLALDRVCLLTPDAFDTNA